MKLTYAALARASNDRTSEIRTRLENLRTIARRTIWLQGLGAVEGKPAEMLEVGDVTVWNHGGSETILGRLHETPSTITFQTSYVDSSGTTRASQRKFNRAKIVGISIAGKITTHNITREEHSRYRN